MLKKKAEEAMDFNIHPRYIVGVPVNGKETESGIILPDQDPSNAKFVKILQIGEQARKEMPEGFIKEGDEVYIISPYTVGVCNINSIDFIVIMPDGILGVRK